MKEKFRDWHIPGPIPPGARGEGPAVEEGETLDSLSGHCRIFQLARGHRFSTDDILAAWYGTSWSISPRSILDLGSGLGTLGMVAAWRLPGARVVSVEVQSESVRLARKSVRWNGWDDRFDIREGDFRQPGVLGEAERFDLVLGSPPYFPPGKGVLGDHPQKIACRFEMNGCILDYSRAAGKHLAAGGVFACVFPVNPPEQHRRVEEAARMERLTIVRWRPVALKEGEPPLLGLFVMMRDEDLPEPFRGKPWTEPPLIIRSRAGTVHPEYSAIKLSFGFPP